MSHPIKKNLLGVGSISLMEVLEHFWDYFYPRSLLNSIKMELFAVPITNILNYSFWHVQMFRKSLNFMASTKKDIDKDSIPEKTYFSLYLIVDF
jgi:hypothetical protein